MYTGRQDLDYMAWDKNDADEEEAQKRLRRTSTCRQVEAFVQEKCGKPALLITPILFGGLNIHYRMRSEGDPESDVIVRLPWPSCSRFPGEKLLYEAATAELLRLSTRLPIARVLHCGDDSEVGPFIILPFVKNKGDASHALVVPGVDPDITQVLNFDLSEDELGRVLRTMAWCTLEIARPTFPRIGSLVQANGMIQIAGRPLTHNMNTMTQLANIPSAIFPHKDQIFATADEWYLVLAELHLAQLVFQHNDLVTSEEDCRNKYVSRQLFRRLAKAGRLSTFGFAQDDWSAAHGNSQTRPKSSVPDGSGPFHLWCDDFRPNNVLMAPDSDNIAAVLDWEFAYAAPTQFVLDPPWWLLLQIPEMWDSDLEGWTKAYETKLETWLKAMADTEEGAPFLDGLPLSVHMRESWETGRFWLNYAARKSWAFDAVFWTYLDERFYGQRKGEILWKSRFHLLSDGEREAMEPFVQRKMDESRERILVDWEPALAKQRLSELLFD